MKVVDLNIWSGGRLFLPLMNFLKSQNADLYLLQEVYNGKGNHLENRFRTVELLKQQFPNHILEFAPTLVDTRTTEGDIQAGQLIISKFPILSAENLFIDIPFGKYDHDATSDFSQYPANIQKVNILLDGKEVTVLNVHGPVNFNGKEDTDRRLAMRDLVLSQITDCCILAGDFNVQPETETIRSIEARMTSIFSGRLTTSFNLKQKDLKKYPGYATAVVDMFFISKSIKVINSQVLNLDISDHLPLVVELDL